MKKLTDQQLASRFENSTQVGTGEKLDLSGRYCETTKKLYLKFSSVSPLAISYLVASANAVGEDIELVSKRYLAEDKSVLVSEAFKKHYLDEMKKRRFNHEIKNKKYAELRLSEQQ